MNKFWFRLFSFAVLAFLGNSANAGGNSPDSHVRWRCWYDQQSHITCVIDTAPEAGNQPVTSLPTNLPPIVRAMRTNPAALRSKIIHIPMHTEPYDIEFTALLAKSTVCGSRRDCTVHYTDALPPASEIVALLNKNLPAGRGNTAVAMVDDLSDDLE